MCARIGLNSVHSVILLLIRERVVRFLAERWPCPLQLWGGVENLPEKRQGDGRGASSGGDGRKGWAQVLQ